jgi:hypothetical protein
MKLTHETLIFINVSLKSLWLGKIATNNWEIFDKNFYIFLADVHSIQRFFIYWHYFKNIQWNAKGFVKGFVKRVLREEGSRNSFIFIDKKIRKYNIIVSSECLSYQ